MTSDTVSVEAEVEMIDAISAWAEHSRHHPERHSVRKLNKRTVASTDNLLDPLPPPDERLHEGLVEKKIATGASVGHWEPRHALVSKDSFLLSRPTVHVSTSASRAFYFGRCRALFRHG